MNYVHGKTNSLGNSFVYADDLKMSRNASWKVAKQCISAMAIRIRDWKEIGRGIAR